MKHGKRILLLTGSIIFLAGAGRMTVNAEPATLQSASAVVYEQMDEAGNAVGNLIQDGSFELLGSVTAEDGSSWYAVATENGVQGYIKGDTAIHLASAEAPQEAEPPENPPVQEPGEGAGEAPAGAPQEAPAEAEGEPEEAEEGAEETEENPQEAEEDPEEVEGTGEIEFPDRVENTQKKTYAINAGEVKIKSQEGIAESSENPEENTERTSFKTRIQRMDKVFLIFILAFAGVLAAAGVSYRKMGQEKEGRGEAEKDLPDKPDKKKNRKSVRRKKKNKRKKRGKNGHAGNRSYK